MSARKQSPQIYGDKKWREDLKKFLFKTISGFEEDEELVKIILSDMTLWYKAFTHKTFNPNFGENYEELEKLGDASAKLAFLQYLMKRFEIITNAELSEYQSFYLSKPEQAKISIKLGLPKYILTPLDKNIHIFEDVLEAFFGALFTLGEEKIRPGAGYVLCFNLTVFLYDDMEFEEEAALGNSITRVKEFFEKYRLTPYEVDEKSQGKVVLRLTKSDEENLKRNGIHDFSNGILGESSGSTKNLAIKNVNAELLKKFLVLSKTDRWKNFEKLVRRNDELAIKTNEGLAIARDLGYVEIETVIVRSSPVLNYVQLIGKDENGRLHILDTMSGSDKPKNIRIAILDKFIRENS